MRKYHRKKLKQESEYKNTPWQIIEEEFKIENNHKNESIFTIGNGYIGVRGTLEEDYSGPKNTTTPGVYINGIYASKEIIYGEKAPQQPEMCQTILNLPDWTEINLYIDDEKFDMLEGTVENYSRILDMKKGILKRELIWTDPGGNKIKLTIKRFVSLVNRHIGIIRYEVTPLNFDGKIKIVSTLNGDIKNYHELKEQKMMSVKEKKFIKDEGQGLLIGKIESTGFTVGMAVVNRLSCGQMDGNLKYIDNNKLVDEIEVFTAKNEKIVLTKYAAFHTSRDTQKSRLKDQMLINLKRTVNYGYNQVLADHQNYLKEHWQDTDISIKGDPEAEQALNFNTYQLLQSTGRDSFTSVPAKGMTGEYYEGHYFWDTETYILPYFIYTRPEIAKTLLTYRYNILEKARENAKRVRLKGALFPWRTINGREASAFFMGSTVQFHINADIAYAIHLYFTATDDEKFMLDYGLEVLVETARMWVDRGDYIPLMNNKFCYNEVCGPDEYKPGVSNNCYTNYMARFNLKYAAEMLDFYRDRKPEEYQRLKKKINISFEEIKHWEKIAADIYLPYSDELGIHPQDDSFLKKEEINLAELPDEEFPLVRNWHPLSIWRYQVVKQADVILLMLLMSDEFTLEQKKRNYDFYEPKTTHDSSLSPSVYSIIASEIGYYKEAYQYFLQAARIDLDNFNENTYQGLHMACLGSSWMVLVQGMAGMRNIRGELYFNPFLPEKWDGYHFHFRFKKNSLRVTVNQDTVTYNLLEGEELTLHHGEEKIVLTSERNEEKCDIKRSFST